MNPKLAALIAKLQDTENDMYNSQVPYDDNLDARVIGNKTIGYDIDADDFPADKRIIELTKEDMQNHFINEKMNPQKAGILSPKDAMREYGFTQDEMRDSYSDVSKELGKIRFKRLKSMLGR